MYCMMPLKEELDITRICPICLENVSPIEPDTAILRCGHIFHHKPDSANSYCAGIASWRKKNTECPICRQTIKRSKFLKSNQLSNLMLYYYYRCIYDRDFRNQYLTNTQHLSVCDIIHRCRASWRNTLTSVQKRNIRKEYRNGCNPI